MWHAYAIVALLIGAGMLWTLVQIMTMLIEIAACLAETLPSLAGKEEAKHVTATVRRVQ